MKIGNWLRKEIGRNLGKPGIQGLSREDSQRSGGKRRAGRQRSHEDSSVEHPALPPQLRGASRLLTSAPWSIPPRHLISVFPLPAGWPDSFMPGCTRLWGMAVNTMTTNKFSQWTQPLISPREMFPMLPQADSHSSFQSKLHLFSPYLSFALSKYLGSHLFSQLMFGLYS